MSLPWLDKEQLSLHCEPGWLRTVPRSPSPSPNQFPKRPPIGTELAEEMQEHLRRCVALGTVALSNAVKLHGDWLTEDVENPNDY